MEDETDRRRSLRATPARRAAAAAALTTPSVSRRGQATSKNSEAEAVPSVSIAEPAPAAPVAEPVPVPQTASRKPKARSEVPAETPLRRSRRLAGAKPVFSDATSADEGDSVAEDQTASSSSSSSSAAEEIVSSATAAASQEEEKLPTLPSDFVPMSERSTSSPIRPAASTTPTPSSSPTASLSEMFVARNLFTLIVRYSLCLTLHHVTMASVVGLTGTWGQASSLGRVFQLVTTLLSSYVFLAVGGHFSLAPLRSDISSSPDSNTLDSDPLDTAAFALRALANLSFVGAASLLHHYLGQEVYAASALNLAAIGYLLEAFILRAFLIPVGQSDVTLPRTSLIFLQLILSVTLWLSYTSDPSAIATVSDDATALEVFTSKFVGYFGGKMYIPLARLLAGSFLFAGVSHLAVLFSRVPVMGLSAMFGVMQAIFVVAGGAVSVSFFLQSPIPASSSEAISINPLPHQDNAAFTFSAGESIGLSTLCLTLVFLTLADAMMNKIHFSSTKAKAE